MGQGRYYITDLLVPTLLMVIIATAIIAYDAYITTVIYSAHFDQSIVRGTFSQSSIDAAENLARL